MTKTELALDDFIARHESTLTTALRNNVDDFTAGALEVETESPGIAQMFRESAGKFKEALNAWEALAELHDKEDKETEGS